MDISQLEKGKKYFIETETYSISAEYVNQTNDAVCLKNALIDVGRGKETVFFEEHLVLRKSAHTTQILPLNEV
ncbi:MAG: hypothetical protein IJX05_03460 [Clostridia bacterium]|nr:hypothetical protein [Clostridia bacterium]